MCLICMDKKNNEKKQSCVSTRYVRESQAGLVCLLSFQAHLFIIRQVALKG